MEGRRRGLVILVAAALAHGCYLSHERGGDGGAAVRSEGVLVVALSMPRGEDLPPVLVLEVVDQPGFPVIDDARVGPLTPLRLADSGGRICVAVTGPPGTTVDVRARLCSDFPCPEDRAPLLEVVAAQALYPARTTFVRHDWAASAGDSRGVGDATHIFGRCAVAGCGRTDAEHFCVGPMGPHLCEREPDTVTPTTCERRVALRLP